MVLSNPRNNDERCIKAARSGGNEVDYPTPTASSFSGVSRYFPTAGGSRPTPQGMGGNNRARHRYQRRTPCFSHLRHSHVIERLESVHADQQKRALRPFVVENRRKTRWGTGRYALMCSQGPPPTAIYQRRDRNGRHAFCVN